ncbi:F0F1 ATP synthase subunit delta [Micrococcoides hystricis]|uniref:ATP synthase subunit delta n=1 Tax=Micrococcoides hystricis TaxID=1572761 RepID=A0ABV6PCL7_9MICC
MAAASSESLAQAKQELQSTINGADLALAKELFEVLSVLEEQAALRRALTDPSREPAQRAGLVQNLFGAKVSEPAIKVLQTLAGKRWSNERDLGDGLEQIATTVVAAAAERNGLTGLNQLESELLGFNRTVGASHEVQAALTDPLASSQAKTTLAQRLSASVSDEARLLIDQAISSPRGKKPQDLIADFVKQIAARQQRWIATVTVAAPLNEATQNRLATALNGYFGRDLKLNVNVDPAVIGGMKIQVGDEVVDSSIESRLQDLKRKLAG